MDFQEIEAGGAGGTPPSENVLCKLKDGSCISTSSGDCCLRNGSELIGSVVQECPQLILYRLPSGRDVVGNGCAYLADKGTLAEQFDTREKTPSSEHSTELFICKLPSGLGTVATYDECLMDGGTVVAKIAHRREKRS
jgi:hypothetical protein